MARQIPHYVLGALIAPLAGGPAFVAGLVLVDVAQAFPGQVDLRSDWLAHGIGFSALSIIPGWLFAFLPCLIGAAFMAHWGRFVPTTRHPLVWGLAGFLSVSIAVLAVEGIAEKTLAAVTMYGLPGLVCALICRKFTTWRDPIAVADEPVVPPAIAV